VYTGTIRWKIIKSQQQHLASPNSEVKEGLDTMGARVLSRYREGMKA